MQSFKHKSFKQGGYFLLSLLIAVGIIVVSIQSISARITSPVGNLPDKGALLPTGQVITPAAVPGSTFSLLPTGRRPETGGAEAGQAVTTALSPDGKTLLVLTSGYNKNFNDE